LIIDVHAHHMPSVLAEYVRMDVPASVAGTRFGPAGLVFEDRLAMMDEAGVGRQILSVAGGFHAADPVIAAEAVRRGNDELSRLCSERPDRFSFWALLPLPHIEESLREIERALDLPGAAGVFIPCFVQNESVATEAYEPIYAALNRRSAVVFLHPTQNGLVSPLINDWGLTICAGASMEDAVAAMQLIRRDIPRRYADLRFIVPHFGGILPMLLNRLDGQMPTDGLVEAPSASARRMYYDTVGWGSKAALLAAVEAFGSSQIVPGSDYPVLLPWESYAQTFRHIDEAGLDPAVARAILHENAQDLLKAVLKRSA
jgi:6-methylsalicylate decarboxylase